MKLDITAKIYNDEDAARAHLEAQLWPDGPFCPHCGSFNTTALHGKAHRKGLYQCNDCREQFSVTVGTVFERSKIPLHKWVLASHLFAASKKGMSSKQIERMLGVSYKTAWFITMRLREAANDPSAEPMGGEGKTLESDETFVGGKAKNVHKGKPDRKSILNTDDALANLSIGKDFAAHRTVAHTLGEYVSKDGKAHTQTVESFFAILKRGVTGTFHSISEQHLQRYVDEFAFRWNTRASLGVDDFERAAELLKGARGKRLTYRPIIDETQVN
jgi:transposase-like protein